MNNGIVIDKINGDVAFNEELHLYWNTRNKDIKYASVTTLIQNYYEKFDEEFWSSYKAIERIVGVDVFKSMSIKGMLLDVKEWKDSYLDLIDIDKDLFFQTKQDIKDEYKANKDKACEKGTAYHLMRENEWYKDKKAKVSEYIESDDYFDVEKHNWDLNREKAVLPEYLVYYSSKDGLINLAGQIDLLIKDGNDIYILDYKGLPLDTPIATENGWKLLKDITKEDKIFDKDGKLTNIVNISEVHHNPCYEIAFDNNEKIVADHEHRWLISFRNNDKTYRDLVMNTEEISEWIKNKNRNCYTIPKIRNNKSLVLPDVDLPIDPYILGVWLGDGSKACGIVTNINNDLWNEVKRRGYSFSDNLSDGNRAEMRTIYGISPELRKLGLLNNKHIPDLYLRSSHAQRLDLLRGLMDTDGYYNKTRKRFVMSTTQEWQTYDLAKLISSLGWKPTIINSKKVCTNNGKTTTGWDVCFYADENPFLIRNQDIIVDLKSDFHSYRNIISVEKVETVPTKCLEVDSESHTFLAGYSLIVTHNTNAKGVEKKAYFDKKKKQNKKMYYPINNLDDTTYNHYALQLSCYAFMLKQINPNFNVKKLQLLHNAGDGETKIDVPYYEKEVKEMFKDLWKKKSLEREKEILSQIK